MKILKIILIKILILSLITTDIYSQKRNKKSEHNSLSFNIPNSIQWRSIGPFRGGRASSVTGVIDQPNVFYFGL